MILFLAVVSMCLTYTTLRTIPGIMLNANLTMDYIGIRAGRTSIRVENSLLYCWCQKVPDAMEEWAGDNDRFAYARGISAIIGVLKGIGEHGVRNIEVYRNVSLHRCFPASTRYMRAIAWCVEEFVEYELNGEDKQDDSSQNEPKFQVIPPQKIVEVANVELEVTHERRDALQEFALLFAQEIEEAREITLIYGDNQRWTEEEAFNHFAKKARFQLQMRIRHRIRLLDGMTMWCID